MTDFSRRKIIIEEKTEFFRDLRLPGVETLGWDSGVDSATLRQEF
jgi:hypothetical protein